MARIARLVTVLTTALVLGQPVSAIAESSWIHIEVRENGTETTRVNVNLPLSVIKLAAKLTPEKLISDGRIHIDGISNDVDIETIRQMWQEIREAGDNEFVTVQNDDADVRVRIEAGQLLIDVDEHDDESAEKNDGNSKVRIQVPLNVVDALFSGTEGTLDLASAIDQLDSQHGDIVRVEDDENTVRIWVDER